jgi:hypothetical protein
MDNEQNNKISVKEEKDTIETRKKDIETIGEDFYIRY